jgi:hypothetical protein
MKINKIIFFFTIISTIALDSLAMQQGEVTDPDLNVYGVSQLMVPDNSISPFPVYHENIPLGARYVPTLLSQEVIYDHAYTESDGTPVFVGRVPLFGEDVEVRKINNALIVGRLLKNGKTTNKLTSEDAQAIYEKLKKESQQDK